jgi:hypothetical protein
MVPHATRRIRLRGFVTGTKGQSQESIWHTTRDNATAATQFGAGVPSSSCCHSGGNGNIGYISSRTSSRAPGWIRWWPCSVSARRRPSRIQRRTVPGLLPTLCAASTTVSTYRSYARNPTEQHRAPPDHANGQLSGQGPQHLTQRLRLEAAGMRSLDRLQRVGAEQHHIEVLAPKARLLGLLIGELGNLLVGTSSMTLVLRRSTSRVTRKCSMSSAVLIRIALVTRTRYTAATLGPAARLSSSRSSAR